MRFDHKDGGEYVATRSSRVLLLVLIILFPLIASNKVGAADNKYSRSIENYTVPDVVLINQNGEKVHFKEYIETDKPVVLDFIYGTCTTICPVLSAGFVNLQRKLGDDASKARLVSISIDPEHDTPQVMHDYLKRFRAKPGWDFLTGSRKDIDQVMKAFDAYIQNKMSHYQLMLIRSPRDGKWTRIMGLTSGAVLLKEYRQAVEK
jgi:protein SCO1/2